MDFPHDVHTDDFLADFCDDFIMDSLFKHACEERAQVDGYTYYRDDAGAWYREPIVLPIRIYGRAEEADYLEPVAAEDVPPQVFELQRLSALHRRKLACVRFTDENEVVFCAATVLADTFFCMPVDEFTALTEAQVDSAFQLWEPDHPSDRPLVGVALGDEVFGTY